MTIENLDQTTAIGNVPESNAKAYDWLIQLSGELAQSKLAFDEACKAVAEKFAIPVADLKAGIKARQDENANEIVEKLNNKIDVIQEIANA